MSKVKFSLGNRVLLADALRLHRKHVHSTSLSTLLCDGYHYSTNRIYRNIRDAVLATGGSFTDTDYCHYRTFQGASLQAILKARRIIYFDNVTRLTEVERARPKRFNIGEIDFYHSNVLHESSHLLADLTLSEALFKRLKHKDRDQLCALRIVAAEAIASTHDLLGAYETKSYEAGAIYFSAVTWKAEKQISFNHAVKAVGFAGAYKCVFFGFLYAYMLYRRLDSRDIRRVLRMLFPDRELTVSEQRFMTTLLKWGNDRFIANEIQISNFYFRLVLKRDRNIFDLLGFDFARVFEAHPQLISRLDGLAEIAETGVNSPFVDRLESERRSSQRSTRTSKRGLNL